jgi:hypothetical protein
MLLSGLPWRRRGIWERVYRRTDSFDRRRAIMQAGPISVVASLLAAAVSPSLADGISTANRQTTGRGLGNQAPGG